MADEAKIHVGDVGTAFVIAFKDEDGNILDISGASSMKVWFLKPDNTTVLVKDGAYTTDGTDGKMQYVSQDGDLNTPGNWQIQGKVTYPGGVVHSDIVKFKVYKNLQ